MKFNICTSKRKSPPEKNEFLDALASLDSKLSVSESVIAWCFSASASTGLSELFFIMIEQNVVVLILWLEWLSITIYCYNDIKLTFLDPLHARWNQHLILWIFIIRILASLFFSLPASSPSPLLSCFTYACLWHLPFSSETLDLDLFPKIETRS